MPARAATEISPLPTPERPRKKAHAVVPSPVSVNTTAAAAVQDRRSISPRTVPAAIAPVQQPAPVTSPTVAMPMSMAPTQPAPASAVIQAANSALKSPTEAAPIAAMPGFPGAFDWQMAAAAQVRSVALSRLLIAQYASMPDFFNPFAFDAAAAFGGYPTQQPQQCMTAPQFWAAYAHQAAGAMPFAVAS